MNRLTKTGLVGTVIVALCCFTPLLIWALAALGLIALAPYLDPILLPLLGVFIALTIWGLIRSFPNKSDKPLK